MRKTLTLGELIEKTTLTKDPKQIAEFHRLRKQAFDMATKVYADREASYNTDHEPIEEMVFGSLSLASELYKRARRMCGLLSPKRKVPLRPADLNRLVDLNIDFMNYASWNYAMLLMAMGEGGNGMCDDAPQYMEQESESVGV